MIVEVKTWILSIHPVTENDCIWIKSLGCEITIENAVTERVQLPNGNINYYVTESAKLLVKTVSEKQQSMLQLKYATNLFLKSTEYEFPSFIRR